MSPSSDQAPRVERFRSRGGIELAVDAYGDGAPVAVVVSHGIFAHRRLPELQALAAHLRAGGDLDVRVVDCRGHGDSAGRFSFGLHEWEDLRDLAASLRPRYRAVAGVGFSFGAFHTCLAAALGGAFDVVSLVAGPKSFAIFDHNFFGRGFGPAMRMARQRRRRRTRLGFELRPRVMPIAVVDRVAVPIQILHGEDDWLIHPRHAEALYARARDPKELVILPRGMHAEYLVQQMPEQVLPVLAGWVRRWTSVANAAATT